MSRTLWFSGASFRAPFSKARQACNHRLRAERLIQSRLQGELKVVNSREWMGPLREPPLGSSAWRDRWRRSRPMVWAGRGLKCLNI